MKGLDEIKAADAPEPLHVTNFGDVELTVRDVNEDSVQVSVRVENTTRAIRIYPTHVRSLNRALAKWLLEVVDGEPLVAPIHMRLHCPECGELHIDEGEFATKPHHTHACQACGAVWRPAIVNTYGVRFLPGFKNEEPSRG